jgi:hypothetical protein
MYDAGSDFLTAYLLENPELLAGLGNDMFKDTSIKGGKSGFKEPAMPGEQRLIPRMQERTTPQLPGYTRDLMA